ncbi:MAG: hypothetical protein WAW23_04965 [Candidatus Methanoperedens sp.]
MIDRNRITYEDCNEANVSDLMKAINRIWVKGHVLSYDRLLLRWQYNSIFQTDELNFVLARESSSDEIIGFMGFIHNSTFDQSLVQREDGYLWGALWKVQDDFLGMSIGKKLFQRMQSRINAPYAAFGINDEIAKLYNKMGFELGSMNQFFIANSSLTEYKLLGIKDSRQAFSAFAKRSRDYEYLLLHEKDLVDQARLIDDLSPTHIIPRKTVLYFINRYLRHPVYHYDIFAIYEHSQLKALLVTRRCYAENRKAIRVIDFIGEEDQIKNIADLLFRQIEDTGAEYADFINFGIDEQVFIDAGFKKVAYDDEAEIVPNYYEPFIRKNVLLRFACEKMQKNKMWLFKGDSDQDRPNL